MLKQLHFFEKDVALKTEELLSINQPRDGLLMEMKVGIMFTTRTLANNPVNIVEKMKPNQRRLKR